MLRFFSKYQKVFFVVITLVIVITFSFFGTYKATSGAPTARTDKIVGTLIDGSPLKQSALDQMCYFLTHDRNHLFEPHSPINTLNDGVVLKDFLQTNIAQILAENHFDALKDDLQKRLESIKKYSFYKHPLTPIISEENVYAQFAPKIITLIEELKAQKEITMETFSNLCDLYCEQLKIPSETVKNVLYYQEGRMGISRDPSLTERDFSLGHFHGMSEWLGGNFVDLVAQYLMNTSIIAKQKGLTVSKEEMYFDLRQNLQNAIKEVSQLKEVFGQNPWQKQLYYLQLSDSQLLSLWETISLSRKYSADTEDSVLLDGESLKDYVHFANQMASVNLYQVPKSLQFKDFNDLLQFRVYLELTGDMSKVKSNLLSIPKESLPLEEIERKVPELVEMQYELFLKKVSLEEVALKIGEKQLWAWQLQPENFSALAMQFPQLKEVSTLTREEKFKALDKIDFSIRKNIDLYSRKKIVQSNPSLIQQAFFDKEGETKMVFLPLKGKATEIGKEVDAAALHALFAIAPLKGSEQITEEMQKAKDQLSCFATSGDNYYQIEVVQKLPGKKLMDFSKAQKGALPELTYAFLEKEYPAICAKYVEKFQVGENEWKPLSEVLEKVGSYFFRDLFVQIDKRMQNDPQVKWDLGDGPYDFYVKNYFASHMEEVKKSLNQGETLSFSEYYQQFIPSYTLVSYKRADEGKIPSIALELPVDAFSDVLLDAKKGICFFQVKEKKEDPVALSQAVEKSRQALSNELKRQMAISQLQKMQKKKALTMPIKRTIDKELSSDV